MSEAKHGLHVRSYVRYHEEIEQSNREQSLAKHMMDDDDYREKPIGILLLPQAAVDSEAAAFVNLQTIGPRIIF
jgi:hypothetical protein